MSGKLSTPAKPLSVSSTSPKILSSEKAGFLNPKAYMQSAIDDMKENHFDVHIIEPKGWDDAEIDRIEQYCKQNGIAMVCGYSQNTVYHHILINKRLGNVVPTNLAYLYCLNKYNMRQLESRPFWFAAVDPINESDEEITAKIPKDEWPFMLKNTSLGGGRGIFKIKNEDDLRKVLKVYRADTQLQKNIEDMMNVIKTEIDPKDLPEVMPPLIAEHLVDIQKSIQYDYQGYITPEGNIIHYGLSEEVYFNNRHALGYLTPPMTLQPTMASKLEEWVEEYMGELVKLGYLNHFFDLEFWVMEDCETIHLTEINPRVSHIKHYNYLYSFGNNLFADNLILDKGGRPGFDNPWNKWKTGEDFKYTLTIVITGHKTGTVSDILDYEYVKQLEEEEKILIRHCKQKDYVITEDDMMTTPGVRLLMIWITGERKEHVIAKEHEIRKKSYKDAEDVEYPAHWRV